ncbi:MAG: PA14 domain-containing protein [Flavihumibacter sp.]
MKKRFTICFSTLFIALFCIIGFSYAQTHTKIAKGAANGSTYTGYVEYLPKDYDASGAEKYPVIIYLHGQGEVGDGSISGLEKLYNNDMLKRIKNGNFPTSFTVNGITKKFIILAPQSPTAYADVLYNMMDFFLSKYPIDTTRIYLTGLSMGGAQVKTYVADLATARYNNIKKIAAVLTICAPGTPAQENCDKIAKENLPFWGTHNLSDPSVSYYGTSGTVDRINKPTAPISAPTPLARKTIFDASGHDAWTKTYDPSFTEVVDGITVNVYQWFLLYTNQRGNSPVVTANAGADVEITLPVTQVTLTGSGSGNDAAGSISGYQWKQISGDNAVIATPNAATTVVSGLSAGTYQFSLTVTSSSGVTASDTVKVTVNSALAASSISNAASTTGNGLTASYFANRVLSGTATLTQTDPLINFNWGTGSPGEGIPADQWSARWTGYILTGEAGTYQFSVTSDDGARLFLYNTTAVIDNYVYQSAKEATGTITLPANTYVPIRIEYFDGNGSASCVLRWTKPSGTKEVIPTGSLFVEAPLSNARIAASESTDTLLLSKAMSISTQEQATLRYYPNPTAGDLRLQLPAQLTGKLQISILSAGGALVAPVSSLDKSSGPLLHTLSLAALRPGLYFIQVRGEQFRQTIRVVKQ